MNLGKLNIKQRIFLSIFIIGIFYILFLKSELYESNTNVIIKDLTNKSTSIGSFSLLLPTNSNTQDIYTIQTYLSSYDELQSLDKLFNLKKHYMSNKIDIVERLKTWNTKEDFLNLYQKRLQIIFDPTTGILNIAFLHTNPKTSYKIVNQLINDANKKLNKYNKLIAQKQLKFITKQVEDNKIALNKSIKRLEEFQNKHSLLDPTQTAQAQFGLLSSLQAELVQKKAKLNQLLQYMNEKNFEVIRLKNDIKETQKTLNKMKQKLASKDNKKSLNLYIFEFDRLKSMVELNTELYKQSLLQLEQIKAEINKNSKMLLVLTKPYIPQGYKYPEKLKDIITLLLILGLLYGIISLIEAIIKEHID